MNSNILGFPTCDPSTLSFQRDKTVLSFPSMKATADTQIEKVCFTPNDLFGVSLAQVLGYVAEAYISHQLFHYYVFKNIRHSDVFRDNSFAGMFDKNYITFLQNKNPAHSPDSFIEIQKSSLKRPDILIHSGDLKCYYEIKPDSDSGKSNGKAKMKAIKEYMDLHKLPYTPGQHLPTLRDIKIFDKFLDVDGKKIPIKCCFSFRQENGLIFYSLCIDTDWELVLEKGKMEEIVRMIYLEFAGALIEIGIKQPIENLLANLSDVTLSQTEIIVLSSFILAGSALFLIPISIATLLTAASTTAAAIVIAKLNISAEENKNDKGHASYDFIR